MCCDVPGLAAKLWIILTVLGWLGLALGVAGMLILHQLDQAHGSGACCSCAWLRPTRIPAAGKPIDMEEAPLALNSQHHYLQDQQNLSYLNGSEPVVEVRISRSTNGGVADDGVRSWLDLRPPGPEMMSSAAGNNARRPISASQSLPAVTH